MADPTRPGAPSTIRLDPSPSKVFSWLQFDPAAPEVRDEATNRLLQPSGPALRVKFRGTGAVWTYWPVSEDEARLVMNPPALYDFSIGKAFNNLIRARKSGRMVQGGDPGMTGRQQAEGPREAERAAGERVSRQAGRQVGKNRRWLA